jgi:hypothetical protein
MCDSLQQVSGEKKLIEMQEMIDESKQCNIVYNVKYATEIDRNLQHVSRITLTGQSFFSHYYLQACQPSPSSPPS